MYHACDINNDTSHGMLVIVLVALTYDSSSHTNMMNTDI